MEVLSGIFTDFTTVLATVWYFFIHGGFIVVVIAAVYVLYLTYRNEITSQFLANQEWVFLNIKTPKENLVSTLAIEQIFAQMHALYSGANFIQKYVEGQVVLWYSLEMVSLGGKISFIVRAPKAFRDLVEAAFYAQYPDAEIVEVADYLANVEYDPESSEFDLWGTEVVTTDDNAFPLRTYKDFEHPTAEQKIIDPLDGLLEGLGRMDPHEFYGVQILIQPANDPEWKPEAETKIKEMLGEKPVSKVTVSGLLMAPIDMFANFSLKGFFGIGKPTAEVKKREYTNFTEVEKERINLAQRKTSKMGYFVKMRHMYIAPKDNMGGKKKAITMGLGFIRNFNYGNGNKLKPDGDTNTKLDYRISPTLEEAYINWVVNKRKKLLFEAYKSRSMGIGASKFVFNIEELATLYHLPLSVGSTVAPVERTEFKKSQPPADLPIGNF